MKILSDIDGCITAGRFSAINLAAIEKLSQFIKKNNVTFILVSGRSQAYIECLAQVLDLDTPYICENGSAIFDPRKKRYIYSASSAISYKIKNILYYNFGMKVEYEPNKEFSLSFRIKSSKYKNIFEEFSEIVTLFRDEDGIEIVHSNSAIDILPAGYNKLVALEFLCKYLNVSSSELMGFGDSNNDLGFLSACGITGAPSNCTSQVSQAVHFVSSMPDIFGLLEFLELHK